MMDYYVINTVKCKDYGTCGIHIKQAEKHESLNSISNGIILSITIYIYTHKNPTFLTIAVHFARSLSRHIHISDRK